MGVVVRPYEPADLVNVARLRASVYSHPDDDELAWYAGVWRWLEQHPLADDLRRWVLADGDQVVGFLAAVPQYYRINGQRVIAHTPADYQVHPAYRFHAITLMRQFFRSCANCVTCDWLEPVIQVERWLGARAVGEMEHVGKLFTVAKIPAAIPLPAQRLLNGSLHLADAALTGLVRSAHEVAVVDEFDERFDRLFAAVTRSLPCAAEKDAAFLRWRYGPGSPHAEKRVLAVEGDGGLLGYAVLRVTATDQTGYIFDLTTLPGRSEVALALLRQTVRHFRESSVHLIRYRFLRSPTAPRARDLWRLGFFPRRQRHTLLVKFADPAPQRVALDPVNWTYSAGDGELSFWAR